MGTLSKETLQRFTHCFHPLTEVSADSEFLCKGCRTPGSGTRYRCEICGLDLHEYCADCPMELSSFMHKHSLKLVVCKPDHGCDLCNDRVEGLCYRCELCDFDVHPICTQLPEYICHGKHKDHPLRLEDISVPTGCMVCKDMCLSWRYRCEVCSFHLHVDCTSASAPPCEGGSTMSKTKTRSLGTPATPQPPAWPPAYNWGYGYECIPPPHQHQYYAQPSFPPHVQGYGGGITPQYYAQPPFPPHVQGYGGGITPQYYAQPPLPSHGHGYDYGRIPHIQYFAQPSVAPHVQSYGVIHPLPQYFTQHSFPTDAHGYGTPSTCHAQSSGAEVQGQGGKVLKRMYEIVRNLTLGVFGNVVAGVVLATAGIGNF